MGIFVYIGILVVSLVYGYGTYKLMWSEKSKLWQVASYIFAVFNFLHLGYALYNMQVLYHNVTNAQMECKGDAVVVWPGNNYETTCVNRVGEKEE